ncbi:MAG: hypothetical protein QOF08_2192, partial [Gaiellales bacterium]|nr:hypothetical protein [Gaiellales bacterium]
RVHGRRRRRIVEELAAHLREGAAHHGEAAAIERMGDSHDVARSFTPRLVDRAFEQRDRLSALAMLAAMLASLPLAVDLRNLGQQAGSHAWLWFFLFLAPTAAVALVACLAVLGRRPLGLRLARPLVAMVALTAFMVVLDLPPSAGEFRQYRVAVRAGHDARGCTGRTLAACADDHAGEIRVNYSIGAVVLSVIYLWAVAGWTPRRRRRQQALA